MTLLVAGVGRQALRESESDDKCRPVSPCRIVPLVFGLRREQLRAASATRLDFATN
jgi:hypothetical protein